MQGLFESANSLGELPEKHTYVWHLHLALQKLGHQDGKCLQVKTFGD